MYLEGNQLMIIPVKKEILFCFYQANTYFCFTKSGANSSAGQSNGFLNRRSQVRTLIGVLKNRRSEHTEKVFCKNNQNGHLEFGADLAPFWRSCGAEMSSRFKDFLGRLLCFRRTSYICCYKQQQIKGTFKYDYLDSLKIPLNLILSSRKIEKTYILQAQQC